MNFKFISVPLMVLSLFMTSSCSDDDSRIIHPDRPDVPTPQPPVEEYDTPAGVLFSTFKGRVMCGYQGWFTAPGDECSSRGWTHWTATGIGKFEPGYCSIDFGRMSRNMKRPMTLHLYTLTEQRQRYSLPQIKAPLICISNG